MVPRTHYVEFFEPVSTLDAAGAATITYTSKFSMPVSFRIEREQLTTEGDIRPTGQVSARVRMPYYASLTRGWRMTYDNETYDIETARDPFGDRKELELLVVAVEQ